MKTVKCCNNSLPVFYCSINEKLNRSAILLSGRKVYKETGVKREGGIP